MRYQTILEQVTLQSSKGIFSNQLSYEATDVGSWWFAGDVGDLLVMLGAGDL